MKKIIKFFMFGMLITGCVNTKVVEYNSERLDVIEAYLKENKQIKPSEDFEKLQAEGKINYVEEHKSLEMEAQAWKENLEK